MQLRVLYVTSTPSWQLGPVMQRSGRLAAHDVEVMVVDRHFGAVDHDPDASGVFIAAANDPSVDVLVDRLMAIAETYDPHVVHVHDPHDPRLAQACRALARVPVSRLLEVRRGDPMPEHVESLLPAQVAVPSPELRRAHQATGIDAEHFCLVAESCVHPGSVRPSAVRGMATVGHRPLVVCHGGSEATRDNPVIDLTAALHGRDPNVAVAAWIPEPLRPHLRRQARAAGLEDANFLLFSPESGVELDDLLSAADLAVAHAGQTPWLTCVPFFLRAVAAGTPIVTDFECWVTDTMRSSGAGLLLDADNSWASIEICRNLRNPAWRTEARTAARHLSTHHAFDPNRADDALLDAYRAAADIERAA